MIFSYKLLKEYVDVEGLSIKDITSKLTLAGFELEGIEQLSSGTNLVIGEVLECVMHPDSDHLHVCQVNIGDCVTQIVCGAHNVRSGLKVIVALPGAILPGDFEIKKSKNPGKEATKHFCVLDDLNKEKSKGIVLCMANEIFPLDKDNYLVPIRYI